MTSSTPANPSESAFLLHSGAVFSGTDLHAGATAVLISGERILAVGTDAELRPQARQLGAEEIDLQGGLVTPGFVDAHVHAVMGGVERNACDLTQAGTAEDTLLAIRKYAESTAVVGQSGNWIIGAGWYKGNFPPGAATAEVLDTVTGGRPAYLINADHHSAWVNTAALHLAGVTASTPDPGDGVIDRHPDGTPLGILHEGAMDLVGRHLPEFTTAQLAEGLVVGGQYLHSVGVTGWQEAILGDYAGYPDASAAYREVRERGGIPESATGALWVPRNLTVESVPELIEQFILRRKENEAAGFITRAAKLMVDGVPENRTAAMLEKYCECERLTGGSRNAGPDGRGLAYLGREVLLAVGVALDAAGFDLHFHAIGDRAVRWSLDTVAAVRKANPDSTARHHLAHLQIVHPEDVPRFAETGTTANLQALWACNDAQMADQTVPLLGAERASWQYPFRSIEAAGGRLCMGSDWPVSTPDPWQALHVAVNRTYPPTLDKAVAENDPLQPGEALELRSALAAYTAGSAWQLHLGSGRGRIEAGAAADLAVADRNPFEAVALGHPEKIAETRNVLTFLSGRVVFDGR